MSQLHILAARVGSNVPISGLSRFGSARYPIKCSRPPCSNLPPRGAVLLCPKVLIDRAHDIDVADPEYFTKYLRYLNQQAFFAGENATIPDYDAMPQRQTVRSDYDDVFEDSNWWDPSPRRCCEKECLFRLFRGPR